MKTFIIYLALLIFFCVDSFAQISQGGMPISFLMQNGIVLQKNIPTQTMPSLNIDQYKSEDVLNDNNKSIPWRFGANIPVDFDIKAKAVFDLLPNGDKLWRLRIYSPGAITLNFTFDKYALSKGAQLFIYNDQNNQYYGAFTDFNNQADQYFATTLIEGEALIIEYFEPKIVDFSGSLHLSKVTHGYRNVYDYVAKAFNSSGSCNNNVACPIAAGWEKEIRSVCMLVVGSNGFCSGSLVNNTANDGTPYVLTAKHCSGSNNFSSWIFWFNWQSQICVNPTSSPLHDQVTTSGCVLKARNAGSDFCLVQMNQAPPAGFNVYYAGWSNEQVSPVSTACIHHPSADIKKFTAGGAGTPVAYDAGYGMADCWNVLWSSGVTEPGSSGSPLFDQNHKLVGQLYGGPSSCGSSPPDKNDFYGKFSTSWDGLDSSLRLKDWLDPIHINATIISGYDPNIPVFSVDVKLASVSVPLSSYCSVQDIIPQVIIQNHGTSTIDSVRINYSIDGGAWVQKNWSGILASNDVVTISFLPITLTLGNHSFKVFTSNPNGVQDENTTNDTIIKSFNVTAGLPLPYLQNFEDTIFSPVGITINNSDGSYGWERSSNAGGNGTSTGAAFINLRSYTNGLNQKDEMVLPVTDLSIATSASLKFKVAYRRYNTSFSDTLKVLVSNDCGTTFNNVLYYFGGYDLATGSDMTTPFIPSSINDWRVETVNLNTFVGQSVIIKFQSINHNGNNLYIDDINVESMTDPPIADFSVSETTLCGGSINFFDQSVNSPVSWLWKFGDGDSSELQNPVHSYLTNGIYTVSLKVTNAYGSDLKIKTNYIIADVPASPLVQSSVLCGSGIDTLYASGSGVLYWYDALSGGNLVTTGTSFVTPYLNNSTDYFVENHRESFSYYGGSMDSTTNGGYGNFTTEQWLDFECLAPARLVSVVVNANMSGLRTILLRDGNNAPIDSVTIDIPAGVSRVLLNFNLHPGLYKLVGLANANLFRNNVNVIYPYSIPGFINITGSSSAYRYYYFYEWEIKKPDCISSRTKISAFVNPPLSGGIVNTNHSSVCTGDSATLSLTGFVGNIQWQQSLDSLHWTDITGENMPDCKLNNLIETKFYRAELSQSGCSNVYSAISQIIVHEYPIVSITSVNATFSQSDGSATISISGGSGVYTFQWDSMAGFQTSQTASGLHAGSYAVTIIDADGCNVIDSVTVGQLTFVKESIFITSNYIVYPNPANNEIYINEKNNKFYKIELIDISGRILISRTDLNSENLFDLSRIESGIYFINIYFLNDISKLKIILTH